MPATPAPPPPSPPPPQSPPPAATADAATGARTTLRVPCLALAPGAHGLRVAVARVSVPAGLRRDPLLAANALNLLFSVLYALLDFFRGWDEANAALVSAGLMVLGWGYLADAALYLMSWFAGPSAAGAWPRGAALWAELLNVLGSLLYAVTSVLYLWELTSARDADVVFGVEALCTLLFLLDAVLYFVAWYGAPAAPSAGRGCDWRDLDLWGNLLNVAAALIYVVANANGLLLHFSSRGALVEAEGPVVAAAATAKLGSPSLELRIPLAHLGNYSAPDFAPAGASAALLSSGALDDEWTPARPSAVLREMARVYVWGDLVWAVDAAVYLAAWLRDTVTVEAWDEGEDEDEGGGLGGDRDIEDGAQEGKGPGAGRGLGAPLLALTESGVN